MKINHRRREEARRDERMRERKTEEEGNEREEIEGEEEERIQGARSPTTHSSCGLGMLRSTAALMRICFCGGW